MQAPVHSSRPSVETLEARALLDANAFVRGLYADILHRTPSDGEVNGWVSRIQSGTRREDVVHAFVESNEHRAVVVSDDYTKFLGRGADPDGLNFWVQRMANGMREDEVEAEFLASGEYLQHHGGTNDTFVRALYQDELERAADDGGRMFWDGQLAFGISRMEVSIRFVASHEAHLRDVDHIYQELLHRSADDAGRQAWANVLDNGRREFQVMESFCDSGEYLDDHGMG